MTPSVQSLPKFQSEVLAPEPVNIAVTLLDQDNLPLACGRAVLPVLLGVGDFWPNCPIPADRLATAKCFTLPTGEAMNIQSLTLCPGSPPRYEFWVKAP